MKLATIGAMAKMIMATLAIVMIVVSIIIRVNGLIYIFLPKIFAYSKFLLYFCSVVSLYSAGE